MKSLVLMITLSSLAFSCNGAGLEGSISKDSLAQSPYSGGTDTGTVSQPPKQPEPTGPETTQPEPPLVTDIPTPVATQPAVIGGAYLACNPVAQGAECDVYDRQSRSLADPDGLEFYVIAPDLIWKEADYQRIELGKYLIKTNLPAYAVGIQDSTRAISATWILRPMGNLVKNGSFEDYPNTISALFETSATSDWSATPTNATCPKNYIDIQLASPQIPAAKGQRFMDLNAVCDTAGQLYSNHKISQSIPTVKGNLYQMFFSISGNPKATREHSFSVYWNEFNRMSSTFPTTTVLNWMELSFLQVAASDKDKITFHDYVVNTEGFGGLIDDVQVYDLGSGPSP